MKSRHILTIATLLTTISSFASAQIVSAVMTVTGAEMHWWAGVAAEAAARLYDVDEDTVVFKKLDKMEKYDLGVVTFRARKGKLVDLEKLHESVWATRLSGGTRSGLVSLEVVAVGQAIKTQDGAILKVSGSDAEFMLAKSPEEAHAAVFEQLWDSANRDQKVQVKGVIDNYKGRWPSLFQKKLDPVRTILVTGVELAD